jgi:hypothetical protein
VFPFLAEFILLLFPHAHTLLRILFKAGRALVVLVDVVLTPFDALIPDTLWSLGGGGGGGGPPPPPPPPPHPPTHPHTHTHARARASRL